MSTLSLARQDHVTAIYRESYALWGVGLTSAGYQALWEDVRRTEWARRYARFYVWLDDRGRVLSSMKVYRPTMKVLDEISRATVLSAIFTPRAFRRRGHARDLTRAVLDRARSEGDRTAFLFSDIGTGYYSELGFQPLPAEEHSGSLRYARTRPASGWTVRSMNHEDTESIRAAHRSFVLRRPLAFIRDAGHWEFLHTRTHGFFSRSTDPEIRHACRVVDRDGRFAGYVISVEGRGEWNVREIGAVDGDVGMMSDVLRVAGRHAWTTGLRRMRGWLPREVVARLADWRIHAQRRSRAVPMVASLDGSEDRALLAEPGAAYLPFQDQF